MAEPMEEVVISGQEPIPVASVDIPEENARKLRIESHLDELVESIKRLGLIQPIVVIRQGNLYELVSGQRRLLAFRELHRQRIPAVIIRPVGSTTRSLVSLSENLQRRQLPRDDVVRVVGTLFDRYPGTNANKVRLVTRDLGISRRAVIKNLALRLVPPEVLRMVPHRLSAEVAASITSSFWPDTSKIIAIARASTKFTKAEWERAVEAGIRLPDAPVEQILEEAKKPPVKVELKVPLDPSTHEQLVKLARHRNSDVATLVREAIIDMLDTEGE